MKTPLLLIHGAADNNSGTYTMQSERYFNALKGLGATVRLVLLPKESHGYAARESVLHVLWEQDQLLEKYLKDAKE
jgi:dipeptidyl aminopeptidase/acylaminoacyl peptidase